MIRLQPGDSVLFCRGDVFNGKLVITRSGTPQSDIYFGAYGEGEKPVFDGTVLVFNWNQVAPNKWESDNRLRQEKLTNLFINGKRKPLGRWPNENAANKGYLSMKWASGKTHLSSKSIPDASVWQGGDLIVRNNRWVINWSPIVDTRSDTIVIRPTSYDINPEFGFFISNHPKALDFEGEWCFNRISQKIILYATADPGSLNVTVPVIENLISLLGQKYITLENIVLKGSLGNALLIDRCANITIRNTEFFNSGENALFATNSCKITFEGNQICNTNNLGLDFLFCNGSIVRHNTIKNVGLSPAVGSAGTSFIGLGIDGVSNILEYNRIDSVGYIGLRFNGDSTAVCYNLISNTNMVKDDGGGIYTWNGNRPANVDRKIIGNIVWNSLGAGNGTNDTLSASAEGIYIDDGSANVEVIGNTVYNCSNIGLFIHNSYNITARNNLIFNSKKVQLQMLSSGMPNSTIRNCVIKNNIFVSCTAIQRVANWLTDNPRESIQMMGIIDSNYYCRPGDPDKIIYCKFKSGESWYSFDEWKHQFKQDLHTQQSPICFNYKITSKKPPEKITYGFYHNGKDTWYPEETTGKDALIKIKEDLTGNPVNQEKGMNLQLILAMDIELGKGDQTGYLLSFDTKTSKTGESIKANFKTRDDQIVCSKEFSLTTHFQRNELLYIPAFANVPHERVNFEFSDPKSLVWIKNIVFQEADVILPKPDDHFLLVVNDSNNTQAFPVKSGFVDVSGKAPGKSMIIGPYSSVILFKR